MGDTFMSEAREKNVGKYAVKNDMTMEESILAQTTFEGLRSGEFMKNEETLTDEYKVSMFDVIARGADNVRYNHLQRVNEIFPPELAPIRDSTTDSVSDTVNKDAAAPGGSYRKDSLASPKKAVPSH